MVLPVATGISYIDMPDEREYAGLEEFFIESKSRVRSWLLITRDLEQETEGFRCIPLWNWLHMNEP